MGRDFFTQKRFDVGEFEQDLKNVYNAYNDLERSYNRTETQNGLTLTGPIRKI